MRKYLLKIRGFGVMKRELIADTIFLFISFVVSLLAIFIFDVHWSFYPGERIFPPSKFVGISNEIYYVFTFGGTIVLFLLIKLFLIGVKEEEKGIFERVAKRK